MVPPVPKTSCSLSPVAAGAGAAVEAAPEAAGAAEETVEPPQAAKEVAIAPASASATNFFMVIYLISSFMDFCTAAVRRGTLILHAGNHRTYRVVWF